MHILSVTSEAMENPHAQNRLPVACSCSNVLPRAWSDSLPKPSKHLLDSAVHELTTLLLYKQLGNSTACDKL
jgi:hypothetical protein